MISSLHVISYDTMAKENVFSHISAVMAEHVPFPLHYRILSNKIENKLDVIKINM